ncbi:MAG: hypothetical protein ABI770_04345 [Sphingomicrobium sp.]
MRKLMISLAAAGTALAFATPAAAQYYPQQSYGYGQQHIGYNGYGQNNWGQVRQLQARLNNVERQINWLDRRNVVRDDRADRLRYEANNLEHQLRFAARNGLNAYEANSINGRIGWLERQVQYSVANSYGRYGNNGYGYNGHFVDRDGDGRNDDAEHQRWHEQHDGDRDDDNDD